MSIPGEDGLTDKALSGVCVPCYLIIDTSALF
jgi:hypothetical protein